MPPRDPTSQPIVQQLFSLLRRHFLLVCSICLLVLVVFHLLRVIYTRFFHLAHFRGPPWAPFSRFWISRTIASGDSAQIFVDVNKRYGRLARIGPNHLITDDPEFVRRILAARSHYVRGPWFDAIRINPEEANIVSERDRGKHNHLRYQMSAGYAGKEIDGLEDVMNERVADFVDRIDRNWISTAAKTKVFDIANRIQFFAVDMITHLCFGKPLGFVASDSDVFNFLRTIEMQLPIVQHFSVFLELNELLLRAVRIPFLKKYILPSAKDKSGIGVIMGISRNVIDERYAPGAKPKRDMLGSFMKHGLSANEAETEVSISLVAGSDTTATAIRATLLSIISNPRVYARLQNEIDTAVAAGHLSSPIRDDEARRLPYLQACIKEGLRRFPPITQLRERVVPPEGDVYNGIHIPGGTFIGLNAWGLQLDAVYGDDPDVFRPERWLTDDADLVLRMTQVLELIFGHGTTKCLGAPIALMNLNKIFVELLRRFDIETIDPLKPWKSTCYGIFFQHEFNVRITRREVASCATSDSGDTTSPPNPKSPDSS
ncbi:hypothetical protein FH972_022426 [Carpinus fangiana]|uniref:Cytochrome P450 n=1 Tax=Carpinus fangiana TaxID=176857 RepID=A0A5N6KS88_9ROSI|nr:hypothetical protein FH972_022426 [Carpinus fangiana]